MDQSEPKRTKGTEVDWKNRLGLKWTIMDRNSFFFFFKLFWSTTSIVESMMFSIVYKRSMLFYERKGNMLSSFYILKIEILSHDNPKLLSQDLIKK